METLDADYGLDADDDDDDWKLCCCCSEVMEKVLQQLLGTRRKRDYYVHWQSPHQNCPSSSFENTSIRIVRTRLYLSEGATLAYTSIYYMNVQSATTREQTQPRLLQHKVHP